MTPLENASKRLRAWRPGPPWRRQRPLATARKLENCVQIQSDSNPTQARYTVMGRKGHGSAKKATKRVTQQQKQQQQALYASATDGSLGLAGQMLRGLGEVPEGQGVPDNTGLAFYGAACCVSARRSGLSDVEVDNKGVDKVAQDLHRAQTAGLACVALAKAVSTNIVDGYVVFDELGRVLSGMADRKNKEVSRLLEMHTRTAPSSACAPRAAPRATASSPCRTSPQACTSPPTPAGASPSRLTARDPKPPN